jgi:hypothetical protein
LDARGERPHPGRSQSLWRKTCFRKVSLMLDNLF